ncbi:MAG: sugar phosphate isomerase/epimerase [Candidatus Latescibacteria bacterium]|nr:sugar phosphate isomerase/epimerase [Candidatus Latescibacterota bacterium]
MRIGSQARSFGKGIYSSEDEFLSVVREAGEIGIKGLEANWKNVERYFESPDPFRHSLHEAGLEYIGAHYGSRLCDPVTRDDTLVDVERIAPFVSAVGGSYVVCSGHAPQDGAVTGDTWAAMAERLNEFGGICARSDVSVTYHNHWWEPENDGLGRLAELTDPSTVGFAFDTGHCARAGGDVARALREFDSRLAFVHLADYAPDADNPGLRPPLGDGLLDIDAVVDALREVKPESWVVLEESTDRASARDQVSKCVEILSRFCD